MAISFFAFGRPTLCSGPYIDCKLPKPRRQDDAVATVRMGQGHSDEHGARIPTGMPHTVN